jgi:3-dehydroquinate dehydratase-1
LQGLARSSFGINNVSLPDRTSSYTIETSCGWVVGTVYSELSLRAARALAPRPAAPDLLELRVDHFASAPERLEPLAAESPRGLIVTVRAASEGGHGELDGRSRRALYERFLPRAHFVDIELSSLADLGPVAGQARQTEGGLIVSHHDFRAALGLAALRELAGRAAAAGAALFKVAMLAEEPRHVSVLLEFLTTETRLPLAVMGMGRLGRVSRLAAAALGSRLNYGYLDEVEQVPGQWPAAVLRARIDELRRDAPEPAGPLVSGQAGHPKDSGQRTAC